MTALTAPDERTGETLALRIPPDVAAVSTARLFVAATARGVSLDDGDIEDLRLAVSEAATNAVQLHQSSGDDAPIEIRIIASDDVIDVEVLSRWNPQPDDDSLSLTVIRALYPDAEFHSVAGGMTALRMRLPRPTA